MTWEVCCCEDGMEIGTFDFEVDAIEPGVILDDGSGDRLQITEVVAVDAYLGTAVVNVDYLLD